MEGSIITMAVSEEEQKIFDGKWFSPGHPDLAAIKRKTHDLSTEYNATFEGETEKRSAILNEITGKLGKDCRIQGPIYFHYGKHIEIGDRFFANFNLTIQDDAKVIIGDDCNFGPGVTIVTPVHPMLAEERRLLRDVDGVLKHMCRAEPVMIGNDCWMGANVVVCPGVTIGNGCVIGAGSVVTHDIPDNCFAAGNPCRVIREITEKERIIL